METSNSIDLVYDLTGHLEELRELMRSMGGSKHPSWITINFRINKTLKEAQPLIAHRVLNDIDGPL